MSWLEQNSKYKLRSKVAKHIASWSGGKDSSYMVYMLLKNKAPLDEIVFCDTGFEFPEMYSYVEKFERDVIIPSGVKLTKMNDMSGKDVFKQWMFGRFTRGKAKGRVRGWPFTLGMSYCTRELKVQPLKKMQGKDVFWYIGIAADEKKRLKNNPSLIYYLNEIGLSELDCLNGLKEIGLHNPLYDIFKRTGCYVCPKQNDDSLRLIRNNFPEQWAEMLEMQKQIIDENSFNIYFKPNMTLFDIEEKFSKE